jgi:crotonobetainyl-CoA:carnitine CoA-transferase CaiB-like acyl-CoA transferase
MTRSAPLAGVLVVAIEQAVAGPLASRHLLDLKSAADRALLWR